MRLCAVRWSPDFFRKNDLFWPIADAARALEGAPRWPDAAVLSSALPLPAPLAFERAITRPRRDRAPPAPSERYDARIVLAGRIPTRDRSWHDLLNALVWATFPDAKLALHQRQHRAIQSQLREDNHLPGRRTREQDAIAMLDEGGVVILRAATVSIAEATADDLSALIDRGDVRAAVFGHAIYERCVQEPHGSVRAQAFVAPDACDTRDLHASRRAIDAALAALLRAAAPFTRERFGSFVVRW